MKIVLLGASGQLGREWQAFLTEQENEDVALQPYTSSQLDITDTEKLAGELRRQSPDIVINCAAYTDVDGAEEHRAAARKVNTGAVEELAELGAELDYLLVHYSTDYVFPGRAEDRQECPQGYPEDYPAGPVNFYGQTKWEGEQAIRAAGDNHLILRTSWLCGAWGSNFVKTMLRLGRERNELQIVNDQWGSPSFASNVVQNSWALLQARETGTFHLTSEGLITWYDLAQAVFEEEGIDVEAAPVTSDKFPTAARRPRFSKLNTEKLVSVKGIVQEDWRTGLKKMLIQLRNL